MGYLAKGVLQSVNDAVVASVENVGSVNFLLSGVPVGATVSFEGTSDGHTWSAVSATYGPTSAVSTTGSATGIYAVQAGNSLQIRARLSAITSGVFNVAATGVSATSTAVSPLPAGTNNIGFVTDSANIPVPGVTPLTVGTPATAGRSLAINCTVAGNVSMTFSDASTLTIPVSVGLTILPFAITTINASGTTATATYTNLK